MTHFDNNANNLAEIIDHLITVPVFSGSSLASRPVVLELYAAARAKSRGPLVLEAAERIVSAVLALEGKEKKSVILTTGFVVPPWIQPETDGPVGTVSLARSLALAFDLTPIIITEPGSVEKQVELAEQCGFKVASYERAIKVPRSSAVEGFTLDRSAAKGEAERLLEKISPCAIIAVEKASPNRKGVFHSGIGVDVSSLSSKVDALIDSARDVEIPTIGIGDAGNEIGMGMIEDTVREILPTGKDCGCPCHSGVASAISTDSLIVTGTSNWGCSAIEAMLSYHLKAPELLHDGTTEEFLIRAAASAGFIDPASGFADPGVDAIPAKIHASMIEVLNFVTKARYTESMYIKKYREFTKDKEKVARLIKGADES
jgi:D-glutamate cyclase